MTRARLTPLLWRFGEPGTPTGTKYVLAPFAGGSAYSLTEISARLTRIEDTVLVLQYPGRGPRSAEPPADSLTELAAQAAADIAAHTDGEVVLAGHSMGGVLCHETAARLADLGVPVAHAVVSATRPPDRQRLDVNRIRTMSRADWLAELATADFLGSEATPAEAEEIADLMIPVLRADHLLLARYRPTYRPSTVPLLALGGSADPWITPTHLAGWQRWATGAFQTRTLPGGHFYYRDQLDEFCELIRTGPLPLFRSAEKAARS